MGDQLQTSMAEVRYHFEKEYAASESTPVGHRVRFLQSAFNLTGRVVDVRPLEELHVSEPEPACYREPQAFAARVRAEGSEGILYQSVRRPAGRCVAVLRLSLVASAEVRKSVVLEWDGKALARAVE